MNFEIIFQKHKILDRLYYVQKDNYSIVFDKSKGNFIGVVEY